MKTSQLLIVAAMASAMTNARANATDFGYRIPSKYSPRRGTKGQAGDKLARKAAKGKLGVR